MDIKYNFFKKKKNFIKELLKKAHKFVNQKKIKITFLYFAILNFFIFKLIFIYFFLQK